MFKPISDKNKIVPYDVKAEQERQEVARAQQQGDPTGVPTSILKEQASPFEVDQRYRDKVTGANGYVVNLVIDEHADVQNNEFF